MLEWVHIYERDNMPFFLSKIGFNSRGYVTTCIRFLHEYVSYDVCNMILKYGKVVACREYFETQVLYVYVRAKPFSLI